jgi:hypothetical protein
MADVSDDVLRVNGVKSALQTLVDNSRKRVPPPIGGTSFKTLPDGRVIDRLGATVYTPTSRGAKKP